MRKILSVKLHELEQLKPAAPISGFVINMDSATARWAAMERQISRPELEGWVNLQRYPAVDGAQKPATLAQMTPGQWGCYQSHLQILTHFSLTAQPLLIIEDDEQLSPLFRTSAHLSRLANEMDPNWDIIYLDATIVQQNLARELSEIASYSKRTAQLSIVSLDRQEQAFGTHAYLVNGNSRKKISDQLRNLLVQQKAIDNCYVAMHENEAVRAYITAPYLCHGSEETHHSQISQTTDGRITAWVNVRKALAAVAAEDKDNRNLLEQGLSIHNALFGASPFGHFVTTRDRAAS